MATILKVSALCCGLLLVFTVPVPVFLKPYSIYIAIGLAGFIAGDQFGSWQTRRVVRRVVAEWKNEL